MEQLPPSVIAANLIDRITNVRPIQNSEAQKRRQATGQLNA